jgi:hypothetical protein
MVFSSQLCIQRGRCALLYKKCISISFFLYEREKNYCVSLHLEKSVTLKHIAVLTKLKQEGKSLSCFLWSLDFASGSIIMVCLKGTFKRED